jgi:hypothetical protein
MLCSKTVREAARWTKVVAGYVVQSQEPKWAISLCHDWTCSTRTSRYIVGHKGSAASLRALKSPCAQRWSVVIVVWALQCLRNETVRLALNHKAYAVHVVVISAISSRIKRWAARSVCCRG